MVNEQNTQTTRVQTEKEKRKIIEIQSVTPIVSAVEKKKTRNGHKMLCRGTNIGCGGRHF